MPVCKTGPVTAITSLSPAAGSRLREAILRTAAELLADKGFGGLFMGEVASRAGVSRQTVYNEFGNKQGLVQSVALHTAAEFLGGIGERLSAAPDVLAGMRDATIFTIRHGAENRIVAAMLGHHRAEDLLPFVTTRGEPVLAACAEVATDFLRERMPAMSPDYAAQLGEGVARLIISHLLLKTGTAEQAADAVTLFVAPALVAYSSTSDVYIGHQGGLS